MLSDARNGKHNWKYLKQIRTISWCFQGRFRQWLNDNTKSPGSGHIFLCHLSTSVLSSYLFPYDLRIASMAPTPHPTMTRFRKYEPLSSVPFKSKGNLLNYFLHLPSHFISNFVPHAYIRSDIAKKKKITRIALA